MSATSSRSKWKDPEDEMTVKTIQVAQNVLSANRALAAQNRAKLDAAGVVALNLMASPGAGKTSLIERTI